MNQNNNNTLLYMILLVLAFIGLYFSYLLGGLHFMGDSGNWLASSLCGAKGSYFDCQKVNQAAFSTIWGIPMAFLGMGFFIFFILVLIPLLRGSKQSEFWNVILFWAVLFGSAFDLFLLGYSVIAVQGVCPLCFVTYAANWITLIILFVNAKKLMPQGYNIMTNLKNLWANKLNNLSRVRGITQLSAFIIIALGSVFLSQYLVERNALAQNKNQQEEIIGKILTKFKAEKKHDIHIPDYPWYGAEDAPISIVEFSDFMCPACSRVAPILKNLTRQFPGKFKIMFLNYPLDMTCNTGMTRQMHPGACELAQGVHCAAQQDKFWQMHDIIFAHRLHRADTQLTIELAGKIGMDKKKFSECMKKKETSRAIVKQIEEGDRLGVTGTPTLFINGKKYRAAAHPLLFERIMRMELGLDKK